MVTRVTYQGVSTYYETEEEASFYTLSLVAFGAHGEVMVEAFDIPTGEYLDVISEALPYCMEWLN
jgi:hypothetical protein